MIKFSIVVPIYNVEKYLDACLKSIQNQTYRHFEVLMINDGTKDHSVEIMKKYEKDERFFSFHKENGGLSDARNFGITKASGDYLIFVDSDDEIDLRLLENLKQEIDQTHPEVLKYQIEVIGNEKKEEKAPLFSNINGEEAFSKLILNPYFVTACSYAYETKFFKENNFSYTKGRYHEDFGLTPIIVLKAKKISSIDLLGYKYYIRENSIMTDPLKTQKKCEDTLYFFDELLKQIQNLEIKEETKKIACSFISNVVLCKSKTLKKDQRKTFLKELKKRKIENYMLCDNIKRKLKKFLLKICPNFYVNFFVKE